MDWQVIITSLITSFGGTGALIVVIIFLSKKWISTIIEGSVGNEYAKDLENYKSKLQEQMTLSIQKLNAGFQDAVNEKAADKVLFNRFLDVLPSSGSIEFVDTFNMAGFAFWGKELDQLKKFSSRWGRPENQFLDDEIEQKRECLYRIVDEYLVYLSFNSFPLDNNIECYTVPPEWETTHPEKFKEVVNKLHDLAGQLVTAHKDLVKTARKKLTC